MSRVYRLLGMSRPRVGAVYGCPYVGAADHVDLLQQVHMTAVLRLRIEIGYPRIMQGYEIGVVGKVRHLYWWPQLNK